jgi:hypothetical protein
VFQYAFNNPAVGYDPLGLNNFGGPVFQTTDPSKPMYRPPYRNPYEMGVEAQRRIFTGPDFETDPHGGGFRHCVAACEARNQFGPLGNAVVAAWDACFEDEDDPRFGENNKNDKKAEQRGLDIAAAGVDCENGCLSEYPTRSMRGE